MNRAYRIVWSEARQAFVVTHEKAKANGKPSSTRKAVASAVVMALAAMASVPALALPVSSCLGGGAISISAAETANCNLTSGSSLIVTNTGSISVPSGSAAISVTSNSSIGSITNNGAISGGGTGTGTGTGILLSGSGNAGSITNSGTIAGDNGIIIVNGGITGSLINSGGINVSNSGIYLRSASIGGSLTNSGTITGNIYLSSGSSIGSLVNDGGGTISSSRGGITLRSSSIGGGITNNGTISGSSDGISISSGGSVGSITNSGTISGGGNGIAVYSSSIGGSITNNSGGTISGSWAGIRIASGGSVGSITNSGMISASSSSVAAINLGSSSIVGSITNSGTISGGSGGIYLHSFGSIGGSITNSGTISATNGGGINIYSNSSIGGSITNSGTISGSWAGITLYMSSIGGSITNSDTISASGAAGRGISLERISSITGSLTNSGTISGGTAGRGISIVTSSSIGGGITNSGTISGGTHAIYVDGSSTLANIDIDGNDTARFVGEVFAPNTAVTVLNGATYTMQGGELFTLNGTSTGFANNGTLGVAAGGTGTITGNYTQAAAGTFRTNVTDDTTYGKLVVTGTATLPTNAKIDVNVANPNFAFTATGMAGVITAGTLTWDGTSVVTDNSVLFDFTASKNGNAVDLALAAVAPTGTTGGGGGGAGAVVASVTSTGNISATGAATVLDTLVTAFAGGGTGDADMDTVIGALGGLTTNQQVSDAVGQTLPLMTGGMAQATSANLSGVNHVVQAHQDSNAGLSSGDGFVTDGKVWFKPLGSWADQKDANGAFGYSAQTYGMVFGADGELSQDSSLGAAFAYTRSSVAGNSGAQTAAVDSYQAVLYGSRSLDQSTEFNWQADYGYNQNKGSRYIAFVNRIAQASYNSDSFHVGAGVGHTMPLNDKTSFTPSFRADYTSISDKGYTETGAGALNLVVNGKTTDEFILAVDGKVVHSVNDNARLTANLGLGYDVNARQNSITASFAGGGAAFTTSGINPSSTLVRGGLGYVANTAGGVEITVRYDIETRTGYTGQTASVKARMPF